MHLKPVTDSLLAGLRLPLVKYIVLSPLFRWLCLIRLLRSFLDRSTLRLLIPTCLASLLVLLAPHLLRRSFTKPRASSLSNWVSPRRVRPPTDPPPNITSIFSSSWPIPIGFVVCDTKSKINCLTNLSIRNPRPSSTTWFCLVELWSQVDCRRSKHSWSYVPSWASTRLSRKFPKPPQEAESKWQQAPSAVRLQIVDLLKPCEFSVFQLHNIANYSNEGREKSPITPIRSCWRVRRQFSGLAHILE